MTNQEVRDQLTANEIELNKQGVSIVAIATKVNEVTDEGIASTAICSFSIPTDNEMMNCGNANVGIDYATLSNKAKVLNLTKQAMVVLLLRIPESSHPHILFEAAKEAYLELIGIGFSFEADSLYEEHHITVGMHGIFNKILDRSGFQIKPDQIKGIHVEYYLHLKALSLKNSWKSN